MKTLRESEQQALWRLLADDDARVIELLEEQLAGMGATGRRFLESARSAAPPAAQRSAEKILAIISERESQEAFRDFCASGEDNFSLETACWLLAKTRYPDLDEVAYRARLDQMARELRERLTGRETPRATIEVCNRYLFQMLGFRGNQQDYYDADNSYLNRVLDRRLGIPITLSTVYLFLGSRLGLPLYGVNLPGHFLLKWRSPDVEFFVDPFNQGQVLDRDDCRQVCEQLAGGFSPGYLLTASPRKILARMCRNLQAIYAENDERRAAQMRGYVELLASS